MLLSTRRGRASWLARATAHALVAQEFITTLFEFLGEPANARYRADLVLSNSQGDQYPLTATDFSAGVHVTASRLTVTTTPAYTSAAMSAQLNDLRDLLQAWGSPKLPTTYVTGQMFPVYEQQEAVLPFLAKCVAAAVLLGTACSSAVLTRPMLAMLVQMTVLTTCLGVLGALTPVAGLSLNLVTMVEIVFAACLSIGYGMHIVRAFGGDDMQGGRLSSMITLSRSTSSRGSREDVEAGQRTGARRPKPKARRKAAPTPAATTTLDANNLSIMSYLRGFIGGEERQQRALFGLSSMGRPVLNASFAVGVGLVCLAFTSSYALHSMAVVLLLVIPLGLLHTLAVLPVITSVVGPKTSAWAMSL